MYNKVKKKLKDNGYVVGCFHGFNSASVVEMLGFSGFDFVVIDNEHGPLTWGEVEEMIRAAELAGTMPFVRVAYDAADIQKALDRGAYGIHVPMINSREQAIEVVQRAKFPPTGKRGTAYSCRSALYGVHSGAEYLQHANDEILIAVHIETPEAVENIEAIMSVEGIDVCYIGPTDLSVTMGYASEGPSHPEVQEAMNHVLESGRKHGVTVGTQVGNAPGVTKQMDWGAHYVGVGITPVLYSAFKEAANAGKR